MNEHEQPVNATQPVASLDSALVPKKTNWVPLAFVLLFVAVTIGYAFSYPLIRSGHEPYRPSEARASLGAIKDRARVVYQRRPDIKAFTMEDLGLSAKELEGTEFSAADFTCGGSPEKFWARCRGVYTNEQEDLEVTANLVTGSSNFNR